MLYIADCCASHECDDKKDCGEDHQGHCHDCPTRECRFPCSSHYPYIPAINATFILACTTLFCYPWFLSIEFQDEKPNLEIFHCALHILTFILTFIPNFACASQLCNNQFGIM